MAGQVGERAPDFRLPSTLGQPLSLSDMLRERIAVLAFFHFAFTSG
ncbi:redoxin domain-containing protein [Thermomicrobium sp. CFH 73360]|uniref:Redoxin domain-containing protein n=1 Tax=Thermomicrobium roseum TaxID=500 RepID=A0A7C5VYV7_THERO